MPEHTGFQTFNPTYRTLIRNTEKINLGNLITAVVIPGANAIKLGITSDNDVAATNCRIDKITGPQQEILRIATRVFTNIHTPNIGFSGKSIIVPGHIVHN